MPLTFTSDDFTDTKPDSKLTFTADDFSPKPADKLPPNTPPRISSADVKPDANLVSVNPSARGLTGEQIGKKALEGLKEAQTTSFLDEALPTAEVDKKDSVPMAVGKEAYNLITAIPKFATSGEGFEVMPAAAAAPAVVAAGFTVDMVKNLGEKILDTYKNWGKMSGGQKAAAITEMAGTGALAGLLGHAAKKGVAEEPQMWDSPKTKAVKELFQQTKTAPIAGADPNLAPTVSAAAALRQPDDGQTIQPVIPAKPDFNTAQGVRVKQKPVVPETPPEEVRDVHVLDEIKTRGLKTKKQIQSVFPHLSNEEAAALRNQAWGKPVDAAIPKGAVVTPTGEVAPMSTPEGEHIAPPISQPEVEAPKKASDGERIAAGQSSPAAPAQAGAAGEFPKLPQPASETQTSQQLIPIFRGESSGSGTGNYYSVDREFSRQFTQSGQDKEIKVGFIHPDDVLVKSPLPEATDENQFDEAVAEAKQKGFKAVRFSEGSDGGGKLPDSIYVIDKKSIKPRQLPIPSPVASETQTGKQILDEAVARVNAAIKNPDEGEPQKRFTVTQNDSGQWRRWDVTDTKTGKLIRSDANEKVANDAAEKLEQSQPTPSNPVPAKAGNPPPKPSTPAATPAEAVQKPMPTFDDVWAKVKRNEPLSANEQKVWEDNQAIKTNEKNKSNPDGRNNPVSKPDADMGGSARANGDEELRTETTDSIVARTKVGAERDAAFAERAAASKRVSQSLQPGDVIVDDEGRRHVVDQVAKDGTPYVYPEGGDPNKGGFWSLTPDDVVEKKTAESGDLSSGKLGESARIEKEKQPNLIPQGPGAKTSRAANQPESPETYEGTALKNAVGDYERAIHGFEPSDPVESEAMKKVWDATSKVGENASKDLADSLIANPARGLTSEESAILLRHKVGVEASMNDAAERTWTATTPEAKALAKSDYARWSDHFNELLDAINKRGTAWGREGRWRQALAFKDYSFATQERLLRASKGGKPLTDADLAGLHQKIKELSENAKNQDKLVQDAVDTAIAKMAKEPQPKFAPEVLKEAERIVSSWEQRAVKNKSADAFKEWAQSKIPQGPGGRTAPVAGGNIPAAVFEICGIKVARGLTDRAEFDKQILSEYGQHLQPHLDELWNGANNWLTKNLEDLAKVIGKDRAAKVKGAIRKDDIAGQIAKAKDTIKSKVSESEQNDISHYVQRLAKLFYQQGVRGRNGIVTALHGALNEVIPGITYREASEMFSGYGKYRQLSKEESAVALRSYRDELQKVHKLISMAEGKPPLRSGVEKTTPSEVGKDLISAVNRAKIRFQVPITDPATQLRSALDTRKLQLENKIKDYQSRIANKDFSPRTRRELELDKRAKQLTVDADKIKNQFEQERYKNEMANRTPSEKFWDTTVDWARAVKLMSPYVFPKLLAAGSFRIATAPLYRAAGAPLKLIPGFAQKAPNELNWSKAALAKNIAATLHAGPEAWSKLTKGMSSQDVKAGKMARMKEMSGMVGNAHGMIKEPVRQGEQAQSTQLRIENAIDMGLNPYDPVVEASIFNSAYADAARKIFMGDNLATKYLIRLPITALSKSDKFGAKGFARTIDFLMPIVNIPTNLAIHTMRLNPIFGFGEAGARIALAYRNGEFENGSFKLSEHDAEQISIAFKAGVIGTVLSAYAWLHQEQFGGVSGENDKAKNKTGLKAGQSTVFGFTSPKWMAHVPEMTFLNQVASARRVYDRYVQKNPNDTTGALAELAGFMTLAPVKNLPFVDAIARLASPYNKPGMFAGQVTRDSVMPTGAVNAAYDFKNLMNYLGLPVDKEPERSPKTFGQEWKMAVPVLRETVPVKK